VAHTGSVLREPALEIVGYTHIKLTGLASQDVDEVGPRHAR
jgi:hypothetical protein